MSMVRAKVIGALEVAGGHAGDLVLIDSDLYSVEALIAGGHIEVLPDAPLAGMAQGDS